ncbi:RIP metalloprotease RseP [Methylibium rhizosphaerae]|uniref:RIP metalloprotease RseP n=1 Tax=Methylibium rhizosphaerae TaxID=2570323 RepID=UPI00112D00C2|nr:RIP metalloprotease RseP [Methylibium rhizosphaerae]
MTTVVAFLITLGVLIVVHEYGHYRVAVACGVKVLRFSVGFGRVIWRRQRGDTEFAVSAIPLGGYVKMLDEREGEVLPHELHRAFNRKPLWQRAAVVAAGPVANLVLAWFLFAAASWWGVNEPKAVLGTPEPASLAEQAGVRSGDWVRAVSTDGSEWTDVASLPELSWYITQAVLNSERLHLELTDSQGHGRRNAVLELGRLAAKDVDAQLMRRIGVLQPYSEPLLRDVVAGGPAGQAGLQKGDRVLSVDGEAVPDATRLLQIIRGAVQGTEPRPMVWRVQRGQEVIEATVTPAVVQDKDRSVGRVEAYLGGAVDMVLVRRGVFEGLGRAATRTWDTAALNLTMLGKMLIGQASLKNLSGPLTIADYAGQSVQRGVAYYLAFLAIVSVGLGVLNLLPLPMLDGGHLMYYLFEGVTGRPVSDVWLDRLQRGGLAIMLLMMSLALYNDVARLLGLH